MRHGNYIWQAPDWPQWRYDHAALANPLAAVSHAQGLLIGRVADIDRSVQDRVGLVALTEEIVKTSQIEGETPDAATVRSSLARRLGVEIGALAPVDRYVEGLVAVILDATIHCAQPLTPPRLFSWHAALFPTSFSALTRIRVGAWRDDAGGPMQVVSGPIGRQIVHYQAPPAPQLAREIAGFLNWANANTPVPALIKAGLAHLWFVSLHPFDDGNGRIARAIGDLFLARADGAPQRYYSLSAQIQRARQDYYDILERTQKETLDVTCWLIWFLDMLLRAVNDAQGNLDEVLRKAHFWQQWGDIPMNARQVKLLNRLLDGFDGKLTARKWAAIAKCSADTALRDITDLISRGILKQSPGGGRSTAYELNA
jgi:Fic family protein